MEFKKYNKILIANRGEIAIRVARTCREMGISTVGIHSVEDEDSLHVKIVDESVCIGPASSKESYLNMPAILSAADITGADAIHPGYGFLAENAAFARACEELGIDFIGPSSGLIERLGDKVHSKNLAKEAGVSVLEPVIVGEEGYREKIQKMGFPLIIKAAAGGGGRGMRILEREEDLDEAIELLKREALSSFGDDSLFLEKYIKRPRHIEVQVIGDKHSHIIHMGERDCTIQRRFQKILEEAPSPVLSDKMRESICADAVKIARYVNYDSVGTVEFLYDLDTEKYYFMEMNTRIQVEHCVTEELLRVDLIYHQIKVSQGYPLELTPGDIRPEGHVMEFRVNAEDPITMLPRPGTINHYHRPGGLGVRVDDYIYTGYKISPYYDSLISKIIVKAETRESCLKRAKRVLAETVVEGIETNLSLHQKIIETSSFLNADYSTHFLKDYEA